MAAPSHHFGGFETQNSLAPEIGRTNAILDNEQALHVREHLGRAQIELQQWHREFALLLARRPCIVDRVYRCKVALAPYKKLPVEITREIMLFVVGVPPDLPLAKEAALDPRIQITHVCTNWRRITFDTPEIWNITLTRTPGRSSTSQLINAWWSQCSGSQLSLITNELQEPRPERRSNNISFDHLLLEHAIFPYSTRLVTLKVVVGVETARKIFALPAGSFEALQSLVLIIIPHSDESDPFLRLDDINTAFGTSPSLSTVAIRGPSIKTDPLLLHLPWHQLTLLGLGSLIIPVDRLLVLLSHCPLLSTCLINAVITIDTDTVTRIASMPVLRLANLTTLSLILARSLNHHHFLPALSLPKLSHLTLSLPQSPDWGAPYFAAFLQRTASTLTQCKFQTSKIKNVRIVLGTVPSNHHFDELLISYMPLVETFEVPDWLPISPSTLERIGRGELLPSATTITFGVNSLRPALEMLEARLSRSRESTADGQTAISAIKTAVVSCHSSSSLDDMIQGLKDRGIDVQVKVLP